MTTLCGKQWAYLGYPCHSEISIVFSLLSQRESQTDDSRRFCLRIPAKQRFCAKNTLLFPPPVFRSAIYARPDVCKDRPRPCLWVFE